MAITAAEIEREKQRLPRAWGQEMTKTTNVVLAGTNERLIAIRTGLDGAPGDEVSLPYEGLEIVSSGKKEFVLGWPDTQLRFRGAHKQQVPEFLDTMPARSRPANVQA